MSRSTWCSLHHPRGLNGQLSPPSSPTPAAPSPPDLPLRHVSCRTERVTSCSPPSSPYPPPQFHLFAPIACHRRRRAFFSASCLCRPAALAILRSPQATQCYPLTSAVPMLASYLPECHRVAVAAARTHALPPPSSPPSPRCFPSDAAATRRTLVPLAFRFASRRPLPCRRHRLPKAASNLLYFSLFAISLSLSYR